MSGRNALCVCLKGVEIVAKLNNKVLPCTDLSKKFEILLEIYNNKKTTPAALSPSNHTDMNIYALGWSVKSKVTQQHFVLFTISLMQDKRTKFPDQPEGCHVMLSHSIKFHFIPQKLHENSIFLH